MRGFLLGLVVAALAFGGYVYWKDANRSPAAPKVAAPAPDPALKEHEHKHRKRRGALRVARADGLTPASESEPVKLSAADLRLVSQGDDLSRPDVLHLGDASDTGGAPELGQDDIDVRFRAREEAILDCIARARPDEDTYVPGRVTVKFRIQRTGNVRGVRVEAPAILQRGGLTGCVKGVVGGLRFPPSNGSQVVSYPFSLT